MRSFLIRLGVFFGLLVSVLYGLRTLVPYYYANPNVLGKYGYLNLHENFNLVFLGSSRTYRHVDPEIVDKGLSDYDVQSFNLGAGGTYGLEVLYLAENLLCSSDLEDLEWLVIELQLPEVIDDRNLRAARSKYYLDWKRYKEALSFIHAYYPKESDGFSVNFHVAWMERMFNIGLFRTQLYGLLSHAYSVKDIGPSSNGFVSLDVAYGYDGGVRFRREALLNEAEVFKTDVDDYLSNLDLDAESSAGDVYLMAHLELIELAEQRGVRVIFCMPPSVRSQSRPGLVWLRNRLPSENVVDLSNPYENPEFYNTSIYFDRGHFNEVGARRYSLVLASAIKAVLDREESSSWDTEHRE